MKKIIKIFLFISILSNANSQDFYIDNGFVRYLDGISSDWEDLNINEAYEFLSRSDFKNIKRSSMDDLEIIQGNKFFKGSEASVVFVRALSFKDKIITGYFDKLEFTTACVLCAAKDMQAMTTAFKFDISTSINGNLKLKKQFYDNYILSLKKDGINLNSSQEFERKRKMLDTDTNYFDFENTIDRGKYVMNRSVSLRLERNVAYTFNSSRIVSLKPKNYFVGRIDLKGVNQYDLKYMVEVFLLDLENRSIEFNKAQSIDVSFENLEGDTFGQSYSTNNDNQIKIKIDPEKWSDASPPKRWYLLYHELGHDVLNLSHGNGGKMMFPFIDKGYSWDEFWKDKEYMLNTF
tara:strand:- start:1332 stop:2375 length:1044 start_codon:yes stop_codon:yes gene_type:complete